MNAVNRERGIRTRASLREAAYRLFLEQGYEKTTVAKIAAAAGVSHMTFFRHFPTKEDVVLRDEYDPLLESLVRGRPATEPPIARIRNAVVTGLAQVYERDRAALLLRTRLILDTPALRSRVGDSMRGSQLAFERGLVPENAGSDTSPLVVRAVAAACTAALATAITAWAESEGTTDLLTLVDEALGSLDGMHLETAAREGEAR